MKTIEIRNTIQAMLFHVRRANNPKLDHRKQEDSMIKLDELYEKLGTLL